MTGPDDGPWYKGGLRFACTACGACCTGEPGAVWVDPAEEAALAEATGLSVPAFRLRHTRLIDGRLSLREKPNGDCTLLNTGTRHCGAYAARPVQCKTWPFWDSNLTSPAAWEQTKRECPGAGKGPLVPLEQIEAQAAARAV